MGRKEIILLDDDMYDTELFISLFKHFNILNPIKTFLTVEDFDAYISSLKSEEMPLLVFVDVRIEGADGLEVIKSIRGNDTTKDLTLVVLTGIADEKTTQKALEYGADAYSVKPLVSEDILGFIKKFRLSIFLSDEQNYDC